MKKTLTLFFLFYFLMGQLVAQQISLPRIDQMPNKPAPYHIRDWKKVARDFDNFVFDASKSGEFLPLSGISTSPGINYPSIFPIRMSSFVGQSFLNSAEAITIIPAVVGGRLVGADKENQFSTNWVVKVKDFFNKANNQNVYLNNYSAGTGGDWWYETMPNIFFYQLYSLYPNADSEFSSQFKSVADVQLSVVKRLGGSSFPWSVPNMNYRAFNLLTGQPNANGVPQPEAAGAISWILYKAYKQTKDLQYRRGAEMALDFLENWNSNPSYEIQLPYGIVTAAQLNAEEGANYNIEKFLNWTFSNGTGTLRNWGTIAGNWNGYDMSGLVGEANDKGADYAFAMNGFQHAAALAPVAKYDKRYARALAKWLLNLTNASRFFYSNALPEGNQEATSLAWSKANDPESCIPFEAIRQTYNGVSPFAAGDALKGGWASTNLGLYSGASVGYLAALIEQTNVNGILQIDLNKTDFYGSNTYLNYLYYNANTGTENVNLNLPSGSFDIYDAITEKVISTNVSASTTFTIPANEVRLLVLFPAGSETEIVGRQLKVKNGGVLDYHYKYNFQPLLRFKSFVADNSEIVSKDSVKFGTVVEGGTNVTYKWLQNGTVIQGAEGDTLVWKGPLTAGNYSIQCVATSGTETVNSEPLAITVLSEDAILPEIIQVNLGTSPFNKSQQVQIEATIKGVADRVLWESSAGTITKAETLSPVWNLPEETGAYTIYLTVSNSVGTVNQGYQVLVKDLDDTNENFNPVIYYPFDGNTNNAASNQFNAVNVDAVLTADPQGELKRAYALENNSQYLYTPNASELNFEDKLSIALWIKPSALGGEEQFVLSHGSWNDRYKLSITPEKKLRFTIKTTDRIVDIDEPTPLQEGVYVHYTCVFTGNTVEIYRNGVLSTWTSLGGTIGTTAKSIAIGRQFENEPSYSYKGAIDEVRIYNSALNAHFIQLLPTIFSEAPASDNVDIKRLEIDGQEWLNINETYFVPCDNNNTTLMVNVEAFAGAKVIGTLPILVDISKPSVQNVKFTISTEDGSLSRDYNLVVEKAFVFSELVSQKWNKVLTVNNNPENNGGFNFVTYEWFKNGSPIGNRQYYSAGNRTEDLLDPTAEYTVKVVTEDGQKLQTCPDQISIRQVSSVSMYPNPVNSGSPLCVDANLEEEVLQNASIYIFTLEGRMVETVKVTNRKTFIEAPGAGLYIFKFVSPQGFHYESKIIVK